MPILSCCLIILVLLEVGEGFSVCPSEEMVEERMEATEAVRESIVIIFSNVLNDSSSTEGNSTLTNMQVYEHIATSVNATVSPSGFVNFEEAISEIAAATFAACSGPEESRVTPDDIPVLTESFFNFTSTGNISQAREVYGKLLCLQSLLTEESHSRKRRQGGFKTDIQLINEFFDMLKGHPTIVSAIFGLTDEQFFGLPPTLAFVVDDTGSMAGEITAVQQLIFSFLSVERTNPIAYILTTFNDPGVGIAVKYFSTNITQLTALQNAVNAIRAHGGGDCPELGMTGILNALALVNPDSNVIVLTDASPKDVEKKQQVIDTANEVRNSIHFFLARSGCGDFSPYLEVAAETEGIVVNQISDFEAFAEFADRVGRFTLENSGSKRKRQTENCIVFMLSIFSQSAAVLFSSSTIDITITSPSGVADRVTSTGTIATYSIDSPEAGEYTVCSATEFEYSLTFTTNLDFFVEYIDVNGSSTSLPPAGSTVGVYVTSSSIANISAEEDLFLNLVLSDGRAFSNVLIHCGSLLTGMITIPDVSFEFQLEGSDSKGNTFQTNVDVKDMDLIVAPYNVTINGSTRYTYSDTLELNCTSEGSPELQYRWSRETSSSNVFPAHTRINNYTIIITNVNISDTGSYTCTVSNEAGNFSTTTTVIVEGAPYNATIDGITHYLTGDTLELNCSSNGSPELQYSWSRNTSSGRNMFPTNTTSNSSSITINNVTVDDEGVYTCTVSNEGGNSSYDIFINIIDTNIIPYTDYYLGYFNNFGGTPSIVLINSESHPMLYSVESPSLEYMHGRVEPESAVVIDLTSSVVVISKSDQNKGIYLNVSSHKATVIGQDIRIHTSETFIVLPSTKLGITEYVYYGMVMVDLTARNSVILVVSTENNTLMNLTTTQSVTVDVGNGIVNVISGRQYSFKLERFQTVYIATFTDLSGTKITTDKPASVFSGHECVLIPSTVSGCDHIVEQIPPTTVWGKVFYISPFLTRRSYTIKILAAYNSTNISIYCNDTLQFGTINEGEFIFRTFTLQEYCAIHSNKIILVAQFGHGQNDDSVNGDPLMVLVPAKMHYTSRFSLSTMRNVNSGFKHFVNIIVLSQYYHPDMIHIKIGSIMQSLDVFTWVPIEVNNVTEAYVLQVNIPEGGAEVVHTDPAALMATTVYGFGSMEGYGHAFDLGVPKNFRSAPYNATIDGITHYLTGDTLELNCSSNGSPELQYSWSRNTSSGRNMFPTNTTSNSSSITINNVTVDDEGVYTCTVSNEVGNSSYDIFITIIDAQELVYTDYYMGYFNNFYGTPSIVLINNEPYPVLYTIEVPELGYTSGRVVPESTLVINLPPTVVVYSRNDEKKGIYLKVSSDKMTVIGQDVRIHTTTTFLALPSVHLGIAKYVYYGMVMTDISARNGIILVVGTENGTMMNLTTTQPVIVNVDNSTTTLISGRKYSFELNRFQTVYIATFNDLSGTKITTDKPASVFSGHECVLIPRTVHGCDHIVEQIPPTAVWGKVFYISPLLTRRSYSVKILAAYNSTNISFYCNDTLQFTSINEGETVVKTFTHEEYCAVHSNNKILVAQFSYGQNDDGANGDPSMILIPAKVHYTSKFSVSTLRNPAISGYQHFVNIMVLSEYYHPDMIQIKIGSIMESLDVFTWVPIKVNNVTEAYALQVNIPEGIAEVIHTDPAALMATTVYGFGLYEGYGHAFDLGVPKGVIDPSTISINVIALNDQIVGQPLSLQCSVSSDVEIPVRVNFTWRSDTLAILRNVEVVATMYNSKVHVDTYNFSQLSTEHDGRTYTCEVVISKIPLIVVTNNITLDIIVPIPNIAILPSDQIFGAVLGSPQDIQCIVSTVSGVELSSVMISWMGPGGESITNDSRVTISPTTSSGNNYTSSLQFSYITREDEGLYACKVVILETNKSVTFEISNVVDCSYMGLSYKVGDVIQPNCSTRCTCQGGYFDCKPQLCLIDGPHCHGAGDPHYRSFDNRYFDFQGDCEYVLTQPCNSSNFVITASNTAINSFVSVTSMVRVIISSRGLEISLSRGSGGTIMINGVLQPNNGDRIVYHSSGVTVFRTGGHPYILLTIGFPVGIFWDGSHYVDLGVSSKWQGMLCGLCGNYNNDNSDDFTLRNGSLTSSVNEFGDSWLYTKTSETCGTPQPPPACSSSIMTEAQARCNELFNSVFNVCRSVVDPTSYVSDCMLDYCLCSTTEREECYCNSLSTYAAACASSGIVISGWRNHFCPINCPSGLVYQQCGPVCPQACDTDEDTDCSSGCVEGCFCPNGKALYQGMCVNAADCEGLFCHHMGIQYEIGDVIQPNCSTICTCQGGNFNCRTQKCVLDGPTCYGWGDPHYRSFDYSYFDFQGDCEYVLSQPCNDSSEFIIAASNTAINSFVSVTSQVRIIIEKRGIEIILGRGYITINGKTQSNEGVIHRSSGVEVTRSGRHAYILLTISYPIAISWDGSHRVDITPSSSWKDMLCGLCGNYNDDNSDDFMLPDGSVTSSVNDFGSSWLYSITSSTCGVPQPPPPCSESIMIAAESRCGELRMGVFSVCNDMIDPEEFIIGCELDYCLCSNGDREDCYCNSLSTYAAACAAVGVIIPNWRNFFCPVECPEGMIYQQCGQACPQTCDTEEDEDCTGGCIEGCFCPSGKVVYNGNCINSSECAALFCHHMGIRYEIGDVIQPNCSTRCTCQGGYFDCKPQKCVLDGPTCYGWGDPHYRSFDYRYFDFQGNCEYVLSQPCNDSSEFIIAASNTAINSFVSVTSQVRIIIEKRGLEIILGRGYITINGKTQSNEGVIHRSSGVEVTRSGSYAYILLTISYPITISWDGSHRVDITPSSSWQDMLCGLCGNYNDDNSDDFMLPDGSVTSSVNDFGNSWLYSKTSSICGVPQPPPPCPSSIMIAAESRCGELRMGVFSVCNDMIDPEEFIIGCELDYCLCSNGDREDCYCNSLSTYAAACAADGVTIPNWRNFFCPIDCPEGMVYQQCGQACPQTCDTEEDEDCTSDCVEGCFCPSGKVLYNGNCINSSECEALFCYHMGIRYEIGDVIQPNCSTRCTCQGRYFDCKPQKCVLDGPTCYGWGDPHYRSFDYRYFDFQGDCEYVLSQPCNDSSEFIIAASNTAINSFVSVTSQVRIIIERKGLEIILGRGNIMINGKIRLNNGVIHRSSGVEVSRSGSYAYILLTITYPIAISWDGSQRVDITPSSSWQGMLCGLCGNYNDDNSDDFMLPDGSVTSSVDNFGSSWLYSSTSSTCRVPEPPPPCPSSIMTAAKSRCGELRMGVFSVCNDMIDPEEFIIGCELDYCSCSDEDREDCYCNSLSTYAAACAADGVTIPNWRNFFCHISCPEGMIYQQCGQACPQTCDTEEDERCTGGCVEGCFCPSGKVLWNGRCINSSECAALYCHHMGIRYEIGDVIQPNCSTRCTCQGGYFDCKPQKCVLDGPTCYGWGDPHYRSFDYRYYDFQGDCEYVLSQPCNDSSEFIIAASNTAINSFVSVTSQVRIIIEKKGLEIILNREHIMINGKIRSNNGVIHRSSGIEVTRSGRHAYILLTISYPIAISWDGSYRVDITPSSSWQGMLCGLCGNYNDDNSDDFMLPDGSVTSSVNDFGSSWLYSNTSSMCGVPEPPPPCPSSIMIAAESRCSELMMGVFNVCNSMVDPTDFILGCELDYCLCSDEDRENCYCNSLSTYAAACAADGVIIPNWRNLFCPIECPEGMVYQQCGQACPQTCDTEEDEGCIGGCVEGCFCPNGKVLWNGRCLNSSECAALYCHHMGVRYEIGDVIQPNCSTRCTCQGGYFDCKPQKCALDGPTCYGWGDPHYRSFDYRYFDFQGDCEYVLSQPCNDSSEFIIAASNTAINSYVSVTSQVKIIIEKKGLEIILDRDHITINGKIRSNNGVIHRSSGVEVIRSGRHAYILLTISYPIAISWDGSQRVDITPSSSWQGMLCGLCGNYNNDNSDDFMLPDGSVTSSVNDFGSSWLYSNTSSTCGVPEPPPPCPSSIMIAAESRCSELMMGVFNVCNSMVDPTDFILGCELDYCLCSDEEREDCYCNSLSTYAAACAADGVIIPNWRNLFCPIECPEGMVYQQCGHPCPRTCDTEEDEDCTGGCVEGCFCPSGKVLWNGKCINSSECEALYCYHMGIQYEIGDMIQPNCSTRCVCQGGYFECTHQMCVVDGPNCYGWGDPHYRSFDYRYFDFQGDCEYILSQPCNNSDFIITASNTAINSYVSATSSVRVIIPSNGLEIILSRGGGGAVTINGALQPNNGDRMILNSSTVEVLRTGGHPYVLLKIGPPIRISFDGSARVDVTVSSGWKGELCGLCGNYNDVSDDDFMLPNGSSTVSANDFGDSWLYAETSSACGSKDPPPSCPTSVMTAAEARCNELSNGVFNVCNSIVNPKPFIDGCILDYCLCHEEDREECYCNSLSTYAAACASSKVIISNWRDLFCPIECPSGMIYQQCGSLCPQTCDTGEDVECSSGCAEGCFCPSGQFTSYGFCLNVTDCEVLKSTYINLTIPEIQLVGESLTLQCSVSTVEGISSTIDVIWSSNHTILAVTENVNISFTDNNSTVYVDNYEIPQVTTADEGRVYQCRIRINQNPPLISESFATLDVTVTTPTVILKPSGPIQGAMVGSPQAIHCIVSTVNGVESSSVMISWMAPGGESIINDSRVTISSTISSGNNYTSSLQFTYLIEGDEGMYTCNVMILEANNSNTVEIQNLTVPAPTIMITAPDTQIVGQSLELNCSGYITRGITSEVEIVWGSETIELNRTDDVNLILIEGTAITYMSTYTIEQLSTSDQDRVYYCELLINSASPVVASDSILLNVTISEVSINVSQSSKEFTIGLSYTLECTFLVTDGVSPFHVNISWNSSTLLFESSRIILSNLTNNGSVYKRSIVFTPLLSFDSGEYTCYADITGFDETMLSDSLIVIPEDPTLMAQLSPPLVTGTSNEDPVKLFCSAVVTEDIILASYHFEWMKNDIPINFSDYRYMVSNNSTASLFIIEANDTDAKADNGMYNCQITLVIAGMDNFSSASNYSEISLEATTPPNEPVAIAVSTKPYSVEISWTITLIIWDRETYWVQYGTDMLLKYDSDVILGNNNTYVTNERYSINITELTPFTTYYFVIWANNSVGNTSTDMMNFTTDQTAPRVAPDNFEVINITSNNITFTWDALVNGANGIIQQYVITCESNITIIVNVSGTNTAQTIIGLDPFTNYTCTLFATTVSNGPATDPITAKTEEQAPSPPFINRLTVIDSYSVHVEWNRPIELNGILTHYTFIYVTPSYTTTLRIPYNGLEMQSFDITGLSPYQQITVTITATNGGGTSERSNEASGRTHEADPGVVEIFNVTSISSNTSLVTWSPPMEPNGIITGYEVIYSVYGLDDESVVGPLANDTFTLNITNLIGGTPYTVIVVAFTSAGRGEENNPHIFFSQEEPPQRAPDDITVVRNDTSISVTWSPLSLFEARGFPVYTVTLTPIFTRTKRQSNIDGTIMIKTNKTNVVIKDLDPDVEYSLELGVETSSGEVKLEMSVPPSKEQSDKNNDDGDSGDDDNSVVLITVVAICAVMVVIIIIIITVIYARKRQKNNFFHKSKSNVDVTAGEVSTNPCVNNNNQVNRPEMEMTNAAYNANDTASTEPQEEMATIHANPSASDDVVRDGMSNPTYTVHLVTSENPSSGGLNSEETHAYRTIDNVQ